MRAPVYLVLLSLFVLVSCGAGGQHPTAPTVLAPPAVVAVSPAPPTSVAPAPDAPVASTPVPGPPAKQACVDRGISFDYGVKSTPAVNNGTCDPVVVRLHLNSLDNATTFTTTPWVTVAPGSRGTFTVNKPANDCAQYDWEVQGWPNYSHATPHFGSGPDDTWKNDRGDCSAPPPIVPPLPPPPPVCKAQRVHGNPNKPEPPKVCK